MCQSEFDNLVKKWKNMDRSDDKKRAAASNFYDKQIFPLIKEVFLAKPENRPPEGRQYDGLILTVGSSPEPLILSICTIQPQRVGLLYTQRTKGVLDRIQEETGLRISELYSREIDGSDITEIYKTIMALYEDWNRPANIAVDITGGKKSMVSGATLAGTVLNADIYYIDNTQFHPKLGNKPEPGSEYLNLLDNPYTVFGDIEADKAKSLYEEHDYAGAQRIFDRLKGQVGDANKAKTYEAYSCLCTAYEAWDNLNIGKAQKFSQQLLDLLNQFSLPELSHLRTFLPRLVEQKKALGCLRKIVRDSECALLAPHGFHFAYTLYHKALRRAAQGKFDTACLILYRLLEWIGQHRLAQQGIDTRSPDYSKFNEKKLFDLYGEKRKAVFTHMDRSTLPAPIGLIDGFFVLYALADDIVENLDWGKFRNQIETRNESVYAHGMSMIDDKKFEAFKATVEERFEKAQKLACINASTFNRQYEFITPF